MVRDHEYVLTAAILRCAIQLNLVRFTALNIFAEVVELLQCALRFSMFGAEMFRKSVDCAVEPTLRSEVLEAPKQRGVFTEFVPNRRAVLVIAIESVGSFLDESHIVLR